MKCRHENIEIREIHKVEMQYYRHNNEWSWHHATIKISEIITARCPKCNQKWKYNKNKLPKCLKAYWDELNESMKE